jgi:hypothetical protein
MMGKHSHDEGESTPPGFQIRKSLPSEQRAREAYERGFRKGMRMGVAYERRYNFTWRTLLPKDESTGLDWILIVSSELTD